MASSVSIARASLQSRQLQSHPSFRARPRMPPHRRSMGRARAAKLGSEAAAGDRLWVHGFRWEVQHIPGREDFGRSRSL